MKTIVFLIACLVAVSTAQAQDRFTADRLPANFPAEIREEMARWDKKLETSKEARATALAELSSSRQELISALAESKPNLANFEKVFARFMEARSTIQSLNTTLYKAHADTLGMMLKSGMIAQPGALTAFNKWVEGFDKELFALPTDTTSLIKRGAELEARLLKNEMTKSAEEDNLERERIQKFQGDLRQAAEENRQQH